MRKFAIAALLLSGVLCSATRSFGQSKEEIKKQFDQNVQTGGQGINTYKPTWDVIMESDIAWQKRVWRTIDLSRPENQLLNLASVHPSFTDVLLKGVDEGALKAYGPEDPNMLSITMTPEMMQSVKTSLLSGKKITSIKIIEDWIFVISTKKMEVRIRKIAPIFAAEGGKEAQAAFWIFYPDARAYLQQQQIAAPDMHPNTLDEFFEGRFFNSKIDRVSEPVSTATPTDK